MSNYLSITEFAARIGVSRQRVHQLVKAKRIKADKLGNGFYIRKLYAHKWAAKRAKENSILEKFKVS
jgi:excisionase family DNA binding protein